jgi:hypothetical protein
MLKKLKRNARKGMYKHLYSDPFYLMLSHPTYYKQQTNNN